MAESFNVGKSSVKGRVVNEPEEVATGNGSLVTFRLAENKRFFDREAQQWKDAAVTYYDVGISKEQLRSNVLASVEKGQQVTVEGNHQVKSFATRDGETGIGHRLYATDVSPSLEWDSLQRQPSAPTTTVEPEVTAETSTQTEQPAADEAGRRLQEEAAQSWHQAQTAQQHLQPQSQPTGPSVG